MTVLLEHTYEVETIAASAAAEGEIGAPSFKGHLCTRPKPAAGNWATSISTNTCHLR